MRTCQTCKYRKLDKERCEPIGCTLISDEKPMAINIHLIGMDGKCPYHSTMENIR